MSRVNNYEIPEPVRLLGEGAIGEVFYAVEAGLGREVALKRLKPERVSGSPGVMDRFRREAQVQAQLNHPNIAQIWEFFQAGGEYYIAMEFINGPNLSRMLRERGRLPYEEAVPYAMQALQGLAHAHKRGIVHRDIKPANLICGKDNQVKVTDFGIAHVRGANRETRVGTVIGTYEYISPEAAQAAETTALSDLYSLGVVLFELLAGKLPFESQNDGELLTMHIRAPRPSVRAYVRDIPPALDNIVRRAMDPKPGNRFRAADEMVAALQDVLSGAAQTSGGLRKLWEDFTGPARTSVQPGPDPNQRRRTDISSTCHRVEDLIEQHMFGEADTVLDAGCRNYPGETGFLELRSRLQRQRQQYEQAITQQAELIRGLLNRGLPDDALRLSLNALSLYPRAAALQDLQRECQRRAELADAAAGERGKVQSHIEELLGACQFDEATDYVLDVLASHPHDGELNKLLARIAQARKTAEKQAALTKAVDLAIGEARALEQSGSPEAARDRIAREIGAAGEDAGLTGELARIEAALEAVRRAGRIAAALMAAANLRREKKLSEALGLLDETAAKEGSEPQLDNTRAAVAAQLEAYRGKVAQAAGKARSQIQGRQWEDAVLGLSIAVREMPGESDLTNLLHSAQRGLAQERREQTISRIRSEAGQLAQELNFTDAVRLLLDAVSRYPDDQTLSEALSQTVFERDAHAAGAQACAARERASQLKREGQFEQAVAVLREAAQEQPENEDLQKTLAELKSEWREIRRGEAVSEAVTLLGKSLAKDDYAPAFERIARALAEWPDDKELLALDQRARAAHRQCEMRKGLRKVLQKAKGLEARGHWDEAVRAFTGLLNEFPEAAEEAGPRLNLARSRADEARRKARMEDLERNVRQWIEAGSLHEAGLELQLAETEFPEEARFAALRERLTQECQRIARESALRSAMEEIRRLLAQRAFRAAEQVLSSLEQNWCAGGATELHELISGAEQAHADTVESALSSVQALLDRQEWDAAGRSALDRMAQYPEEPRFEELHNVARSHLEAQNRSQEVAARIARIETLFAQGALDDAEIQIGESRRLYPEEEGFDELRRRLEKQRREQLQEAAFRKCRAEVEQLCRRRQWQAARLGVTPFLQEAKLRPAAEELLADLSREESQYQSRARQMEADARAHLDAGDWDAAASVCASAAEEYPELPSFPRMLVESRAKSAAKRKSLRVSAADREIRRMVAERQYLEALKEADSSLTEYPEDETLRNLRMLVIAAMDESTALATVVSGLSRLVAAGRGAEADRLFRDAVQRFAGRSELEDLRLRVDAARSTEAECQAREELIGRAHAELDELIGAAKWSEARNRLTVFEGVHGKGFAPRQETRIADAEREAQRVRQAAEDSAKQERQRLARRREIGEQAHTLLDGGQAEAAASLLDRAVREFPEQAEFRALLAAARDRIRKGQTDLAARTEQSVRDLLSARQFEEALRQTSVALTDFPEQRVFHDLRSSALAAIAERSAVSGIIKEVQRLLAAGQWREAEKVLLDAERRYHGSSDIADLRPVVDGARRRQADSRSRGAGLNWALSGMDKLLGRNNPGGAPARKEEFPGHRNTPRPEDNRNQNE